MTARNLLFMALPPPAVREALLKHVRLNRWDRRLGGAMFPACNWHQSLSGLHSATPEMRSRMLRAGAKVAAHACTLLLDEMTSEAHGSTWYWTFRAKTPPPGFGPLLVSIAAALAAEGIETLSSHTPHVTLSYWAPEPLGTWRMEPIPWTLTELRLVVSGGHPYTYKTLGQWPLLPARDNPPPAQAELF